MDDFESLNSKTDADLAQIAVAFGDYTAEEVGSKTREDLIAAIMNGGAKLSQPEVAQIPDVKMEKVSAEAAPVPEEKPAKKRAGRTKKAKEAKATKESVVETPLEALAEKTAEEESAAPAEEKKKTAEKTKAKTPAKRGRKKKTEEAAPAAETEAPAEKTEEKPATENAEQPAPAEATTAPEAAKTEEQNKPRHNERIKSKRRKISFGPGQETKTQVVAADAETEAALEEEPVVEIPPEIEIEGVLSIGNQDGNNKNDFCGFVHRRNYLPGEDDAYVSGQFIKRMGLRRGDYIKGFASPKRGKDRYAPLKRIVSVNGIEVDETNNFENIRRRPKFENLTAIYPDERLTLETEKEDISTRIIDLFSPIGKGQRGMIVSPPKAGKTILLQKVANSITANNPNCILIVLLIDERPEEVTDMQRNIKGEVVYSTFDKRPENHVRVTELVLERAMRLVELGKDVVILLDSMTRLARAYNLTINPTGRTLSGGLDPGSLYGPKRFFGAARNIEHGGSLTILATALIETGSRMDEVIFEEFKGTGNMEVTLDRKLADRRIFPAIAVDKSGTRREDLLLLPEELDAVWLIRRRIAEADTTTATNAVINFMEKTTNNKSFILSVKKSFAAD
ncbi:MAG: transcription termination factor Rho [Saccharofermentans sp.]|nr:transcription termination factor Rho [Saccharofermentans sp.]